MKTIPAIFLTILLCFSVSFGAFSRDISALNAENIIVIEVEIPMPSGTAMTGRIAILTRPDIAPNHVTRIKTLAREKFYDGVIFHRVIANFMAQTGDPTGTGGGGSKLPDLDAEFSRTPHMRGTLSMARQGARPTDPDDVIKKAENSANSQFFICLTRRADLDQNYTVWGRVIAGMNYVDMIPKGEPPMRPAIMKSMRVASDMENWAILAKDFK